MFPALDALVGAWKVIVFVVEGVRAVQAFPSTTPLYVSYRALAPISPNRK